MKTYYYNIKDGSWDEMLYIHQSDKIGEMQPVDNHIRIPKDWTTMIMPIEVWKAYINVILGYKDLTPKRINIWKSFYNDYKMHWDQNGFVKCYVEGEYVTIESLDKYWACMMRICI